MDPFRMFVSASLLMLASGADIDLLIWNGKNPFANKPGSDDPSWFCEGG